MITAILLGLVGVLLFAGTLPATSLALQHYDAWFLTAARAVIAGLLAMATLVWLRRPLPPRPLMLQIIIIGVLVSWLFPGLTALGMERVSAAHGGVVLGILPLITAAIASIINGDRQRALFWGCALLASVIVGGFAMIDGADTASLQPAGSAENENLWQVNSGDLMLLAACCCTAFGYNMSARLARQMNGAEVIAWALVLTLPGALAGCWLFRQPTAVLTTGLIEPLATPMLPPAVDWVPTAGLLYVGICSMFLGYGFWNEALYRGGVARISQLQYLQPFFTLGIAAVVTGDKVSPLMLGVAISVTLLVALAMRAARHNR